MNNGGKKICIIFTLHFKILHHISYGNRYGTISQLSEIHFICLATIMKPLPTQQCSGRSTQPTFDHSSRPMLVHTSNSGQMSLLTTAYLCRSDSRCRDSHVPATTRSDIFHCVSTAVSTPATKVQAHHSYSKSVNNIWSTRNMIVPTVWNEPLASHT